MLKIVYEDEYIRVCDTGRDYDFIATVENKLDEGVDLYLGSAYTDEYGDETPCHIPPNDWIGLLADDEGYSMFNELKDGKYDLILYTLESEREGV